MHVGRSHRVQLGLPVQLDSADHSRSFTGETIDLSRSGLSAQFRVEEQLPSIVWARIDATAVGGGGIAFKAQRIWQGGLPGGQKRANFRIIRIRPQYQERLDQLIGTAVRRLVANLGDLPIFGQSDISELEYLLTLARIRELPAGTILYEIGKHDGAGAYLILDGRAVLELGETTKILGRGLVFGQWAEDGVRAQPATARAGEPLRFLYLPAAFHAEVAVQASRISRVLSDALGGCSHAVAHRAAQALGKRIPR